MQSTLCCLELAKKYMYMFNATEKYVENKQNNTKTKKKQNVINNIDFVFSLPSCLSIFNADVAFV